MSIPEALLVLARFYAHESCGQCTPCREGTNWLESILDRLERGGGRQQDADLLLDMCDNIGGKSLCALGDFAVYPVSSYLRKYRSDFEAHLDGAGCPFTESPIEGIYAPVEQHAGHRGEVEVPA